LNDFIQGSDKEGYERRREKNVDVLHVKMQRSKGKIAQDGVFQKMDGLFWILPQSNRKINICRTNRRNPHEIAGRQPVEPLSLVVKDDKKRLTPIAASMEYPNVDLPKCAAIYF
jgi:hypothetical protein